jgi:hypothetical protein
MAAGLFVRDSCGWNSGAMYFPVSHSSVDVITYLLGFDCVPVGKCESAFRSGFLLPYSTNVLEYPGGGAAGSPERLIPVV